MKKIIALFFLWRVFLFIPVILAPLFISQNHAAGITNLWSYTRPYFPVNSQLLFPWANFDGVHYLTLGWVGYAFNSEARFFPVYPLLIHFFSQLFGAKAAFGPIEFFVAFFLPNIACLVSLIFLYKLLRLDFSEHIVLKTIILLLVFPASFFLGSLYSESIFLLFAILSLYSARKHHWVWASLLAMCLAVTRIVGLAILPVLLYEFFSQEKVWFDPLQIIKRGWSLLLIPLGLVGFFVFSYYQWHNPLYFIHSQSVVVSGREGSLVFPLQTVFRYIKILFGLSPHQFEWWISLLELVSFSFTCWAIYYLWKKKIQVSYIILSLLCFLIPASSGTFSGLPRYVAVLFPLFLSVALIKQRWIQVLYIVLCVVSLFVLIMFFAQGYFVA